METANELLRNWRDINRARGDKAQSRPGPGPRQYPEYSHTTSPSLDSQMGSAIDRMKIGPLPEVPAVDAFGRPTSLPATPDRYSSDPRYNQAPPQQYVQSPPLGSKPPPGARVPIPSGYPQETPLPSRPPPGAYDQSRGDGYSVQW